MGVEGGAASDLSTAGARRRPRWRRWLGAIAAALLLLLVVGDVGAGWYFSSQLLVVDHTREYPLTIQAVAGDEVTLSRDPDALRPIRFGLSWLDGHAVLDSSVRETPDGVVRRVVEVTRGSLNAGSHAQLDHKVFDTDPKSSRGLDFSPVTLHGELGDAPAWYVPPTGTTSRTTWVIAVHGRGVSRTETLRILPTLAASGAPTLAIAYRNDEGAPASPDGLYHLGDTEWREVATAIGYARDHGATGVVLYGWSMGGAIVLTALHRLPPADAGFIRAAVLDSPVLDWNATLSLQAAQRSLPGVLTWTAERLIEIRAHLSLDDFDQVRQASALGVPVLLFVDLDDTTVATAPSLAFAQARPDLVTLVTTRGGEHTGSWNVDPGRYEAAVRDFLATHP